MCWRWEGGLTPWLKLTRVKVTFCQCVSNVSIQQALGLKVLLDAGLKDQFWSIQNPRIAHFEETGLVDTQIPEEQRFLGYLQRDNKRGN